MTPIRLIALDLDGTLLDSGKRLSERNRAALEKAAAKGVEIVPTTGRFFGMMPEAIRALPFVRYAITVNGAQVYDRETDAALARAEIPVATAIAAMEVLDGFDCIYDCYQENWGWMTDAMQRKAADYAPDAHYLTMIRVPGMRTYSPKRTVPLSPILNAISSAEFGCEPSGGISRSPAAALNVPANSNGHSMRLCVWNVPPSWML